MIFQNILDLNSNIEIHKFKEPIIQQSMIQYLNSNIEIHKWK